MQNDWRNLNDIVLGSLREVGNKIGSVLPNIVAAVLVLIIGLLIAGALGKIVEKILRSTQVDSLHSNSVLGRRVNIFPHMEIVPSKIVGWLVKWFFILITLITATNILGWTQITDFLNQVVLYIPNVVIAVIILVIGFIASDFVREILSAALTKSPLTDQERHFLAGGADFAITLFAIMAALTQLKIATTLIQTLFTGIIFALSLALGLAFGLGGREHASAMLSRYTKRLTSSREKQDTIL